LRGPGRGPSEARQAPPSRERVARVRLDELVVARGLAATRAEAARLILAGRVRLGGERADKVGRTVRADAPVEVAAVAPYVGRGGEKLQAALDAFGVSPRDRVCLDVGASTGGFTDCLLGRGARLVHALDVGHGQLHPRLRSDPRVSVREGWNARELTPGTLDPAPSLATVDVSFISLEKVLPAVVACLVPGRPGEAPDVVPLVKPQFEVGRGHVGKGGVVRDRGRHREVLDRLAALAAARGWGLLGVAASPLRGPKGNREFFLHLRPGTATAPAAELEAQVERALG
jgi:23S rRNA (cytidine1920-2'-O)/16S rRNA (cytidine1409-2'-O)-methyltransferase